MNNVVAKDMVATPPPVKTVVLVPMPFKERKAYSLALAGTVPEFLTKAKKDPSFFSNHADST